jgi:NADPH:quinone reductase-like Zn-dependent oxidoreductase
MSQIPLQGRVRWWLISARPASMALITRLDRAAVRTKCGFPIFLVEIFRVLSVRLAQASSILRMAMRYLVSSTRGSRDIIAIKPDWLSHVHAAAVALIGITAIWAIEDTARLVNGEVILIQGGAGGVGGFAVQLARHLGARVITTASANNYAYVKSLGADQVIDYNAQDFTECVAPCDVVFDTVGGDIQSRSYQVLKPGGRLIWIAPGPQGLEAPRHDVRVERPAVFWDRRHLQRILELLKAGSVAPPPIQQFKLSEAGAAHRISEGRHLRGKLVLQP